MFRDTVVQTDLHQKSHIHNQIVAKLRGRSMSGPIISTVRLKWRGYRKEAGSLCRKAEKEFPWTRLNERLATLMVVELMVGERRTNSNSVK